jgi:uncharacterized protein YdhG (YjbR/CyaY superfamily)
MFFYISEKFVPAYLQKTSTMETIETTKFQTVDEYISTFPLQVQAILEELRRVIKQVAPQAEEVISYNMPAIKLKRVLVYYAAYKTHIGFYPTASGIANFKKELSVFKGAKGSVQFPIDKPLPLSLITKIVKFRVKEDLEKANSKVK